MRGDGPAGEAKELGSATWLAIRKAGWAKSRGKGVFPFFLFSFSFKIKTYFKAFSKPNLNSFKTLVKTTEYKSINAPT